MNCNRAFLEDAIDVDDGMLVMAGEKLGLPTDYIRRYLRAAIDDACSQYQIFSTVARPGSRILEIGSGLGFLAMLMRRSGYDVVSLDPLSHGFEDFRVISDLLGHAGVQQIETESSFDRIQGESFDLVVSFNAVEHIPEYASVLRTAAKSLKPGGKLVVGCPNYAFPYEPHVGTFFSQRISADSRPALWRRLNKYERSVLESLNYITAGDMRRVFQQPDYSLHFSRRLFHRSLERLTSSPDFAGKHPLLGIFGGRVIRFMGRLYALLAPPGLISPMLVIVEPAP